jgi:hypothetical protein
VLDFDVFYAYCRACLFEELDEYMQEKAALIEYKEKRRHPMYFHFSV